MDIVSPAKRSKMMSGIRGADTKPEMAVRRAAHAMGLRFRLHRNDLPGTPDIVFPRRRIAMFVHGCFWHRHADCPYAAVPSTRPEFWSAKFRKNIERDRRVDQQLVELGWRVAIIWECETRDAELLRQKLLEFSGTATSTLTTTSREHSRRCHMRAKSWPA